MLSQLCAVDGNRSVAARELKRRNLGSCSIWTMVCVLQVLKYGSSKFNEDSDCVFLRFSMYRC